MLDEIRGEWIQALFKKAPKKIFKAGPAWDQANAGNSSRGFKVQNASDLYAVGLLYDP